MSKREIAVVAGVLFVVLSWGTSIDAAVLRKVADDSRTSGDGLPGIKVSAAATPEFPFVAMGFPVSESWALGDELDCEFGGGWVQNVFIIEPEAGESYGDPIRISYCWEARATVSVTGQGTVGLAKIGIFNNLSCDPLTLDVPDPITIVRDPGGTPVTIFSYGPETIDERDGSMEESGCDEFEAVIGDTIRLWVGGAVGFEPTSTPASGQGEFYTEINMWVGRGLNVPTNTPVGIAVLIILIGLFAAFRLRA